MEEIMEKLTLGLLEIGAVKFGAFRLKLHETKPDAPLSPIYIDLRLLRSYPEFMSLAVNLLREKIDELKYDYFADVPTAGTPFAAILSYIEQVPMITPREVKTHGTGAKIDGAFKSGKTVLLIDDLITKADSKFAAIKVLEENDLIVRDVLVLVDREQGGKKQLEERGYKLHSIFRLSELLFLYLKTGRGIDKEKYDEVMNYLKTNR